MCAGFRSPVTSLKLIYLTNHFNLKSHFVLSHFNYIDCSGDNDGSDDAGGGGGGGDIELQCTASEATAIICRPFIFTRKS